MRIRLVLLTLALTLLFHLAAMPSVRFPVFAQQPARLAPADILILDAKVYTLDAEKPWAQAIAIRKVRIEAIGRDEEVERCRGIGTKWIDTRVEAGVAGMHRWPCAFSGWLARPGAHQPGRRDIFLGLDPRSIAETKVASTIVGGKIAYEAETK